MDQRGRRLRPLKLWRASVGAGEAEGHLDVLGVVWVEGARALPRLDPARLAPLALLPSSSAMLS
ncbi:MAG: hypothetical protein DRJ56_03980 [Thermoprotei archaeon]|nr:MAG: hypothetical protein DRJ56_03980 [Thermoprotei archaeon]